jgi:hypothetical protein
MTTTTTAWLIESANHTTGYQWWAGGSWTRDASRAARFARKEDAEAVIAGLWPGVPHLAVEHAWVS